jgi:hypothetical protein
VGIELYTCNWCCSILVYDITAQELGSPLRGCFEHSPALQSSDSWTDLDATRGAGGGGGLSEIHVSLMGGVMK